MRDGGMNPRLLLVEDDPVSQAYLAEAARALPAEVDCAASIAEALTLAARHRHDAWLLDANLPDGSGAALLARLRELHPSPPPHALAHTASKLPGELAALRKAGFDAIVCKPLAVGAWQAAIRAGLSMETPQAWDDAGALRALNGNADAVSSLRQLFLAELHGQHRAISAAIDAGDAATAHAGLHRLKASCGFVGASRLQQATHMLDANPTAPDARGTFDAAVADLLHAAAQAG